MSFDFSLFKTNTQKVLDHVTQEIGTLRTGRASAQLLDPVSVEAYGTRMKISEVATISVPDANMILIAPWDKGLLSALERAINEANLNINPVVDGQTIRVVIPPLTQERREQMVKLLHQKVEGAKAMLRSVRTDTKKEVEKQKGQPGVSEDMIEADLASLEDQFKVIEEKLEAMAKHKQADLMTI